MRSLFIVGVLIAGTVCAGQAPPPKKAAPARKAPAAQSAFVCPDAEAQQGCKSYQELVRAKDKSLPDHGYICFRRKEDEFFAVAFSTPYFSKRWDEESKQMVPDETPRKGIGYAQTYKDGVLDSSRMPTFNFSGQWKPMAYSESGVFISDVLNFKKQDENDNDVGVSIDETQIMVQFKYQNQLDKTMYYALTIQRSTGRFTESFRPESEKISLSENIGYCVYR
jgi:hypothetical protein